MKRSMGSDSTQGGRAGLRDRRGRALGYVACQLAKARGCTVVGSAGVEEKTRWLLEEAGIDDAIDYRAANLGREARGLRGGSFASSDRVEMLN